MLSTWIQALARKIKPGRKLRSAAPAPRRLPISLRLEVLEDRSVTTTLMIDPPPEILPIPAWTAAGARPVESRSPVLASRGLDRLLTDMRLLSLDGVAGSRPPRPGGSATPAEPISTLGTGASSPPAPAAAAPPLEAPGDLPKQARAETTAQLARPNSELPEPRRTGRPRIATALPATATPTPAAGMTTAAPRMRDNPAPGAPPAPATSAQPIFQAATPLPGNSADALVARTAPVESIATTTRADIPRFLADLPDGALLQRFVAQREQAAFTVLVQRHERVVLGICQRVLGDSHAAQDAMQGTFLVLARKASQLDLRNPLTGWLYKVAYRLALRLRAVAARQRRNEQQAANGRGAATDAAVDDVEEQELRQALGEELRRLPDKHRVPLVLCYFDGCTHDQAARAIGLPRGSMAKRIGEGLDRLRERLLERGFVI